MPNQEELDDKKYGWKKKNITFTKDEDQLKRDIIDASQYMGFTKWMKIAAREKLARDNKSEEHVEHQQYKSEPSVNIPINPPIQKNNSGNMIDSLDDLFKR